MDSIFALIIITYFFGPPLLGGIVALTRKGLILSFAILIGTFFIQMGTYYLYEASDQGGSDEGFTFFVIWPIYLLFFLLLIIKTFGSILSNSLKKPWSSK